MRPHGDPVWVPATGASMPLQRVAFTRSGNGDGAKEGVAGSSFDERWLQTLIHAHPQALPIGELEPALLPAVPVCLELPLPVGYADNLLVNPRGGLILVECKLWRNPEARREVVAQILDYAECLTRWSYEDLERAVRAGSLPEGGKPAGRLYDRVAASGELSEAEFIDAVSANLRRGRVLLLIVGDGIREGVESLSGFLQRHAGMHFSLGLIEMAVHRTPDGLGYIVQPRTLARTTNIERGIVSLDGSHVKVTAPVSTASARTGSASRPGPITEEVFDEELARLDAGLPGRLRAFVDSLAPLGVFTDLKRSMMLKAQITGEQVLNLGYVTPQGLVWTDNCLNWTAKSLNLTDVCTAYLKELAAAIGGEIVTRATGEGYVVKNDTAPRISELLGAGDAWRDAIERFVNGARGQLDAHK